MAGGLFSSYFLSEGVTTTPDWQAIDEERLGAARHAIAALVADFEARAAPNEANTEQDLIEPVLVLLGWGREQRLKQEKANPHGRADVPDYLLFRDTAGKDAAARAAGDRYRHGDTIVEGKRWDEPLDNATRAEAAPSTQLLRYLGTVSVQSDDRIRFGILTNGRLWRLYDNKARSRLEGFVEIDLSVAVVDDHALKLFLAFFGRDAFAPNAGGATTLTRALAASRAFEARVTEALAEVVFERVFPDLSNALAANDPQRGHDTEYLAQLREAALTWLYRLLFVLYAEDRDLLPTRRREDGLWAMREAVARAIDQGEGLAQRRANFDGDLRALWDQIDRGDDGVGLPPYNGGLFRADRSALLDRVRIPDADFAPLLDALSREATEGARRFINFRDLSVQHLGSVYERLLEFDLIEADGMVAARPQTFARKTSGSYYTPDELVMLVIRRTIGPLLEERRQRFRDAIADRERRHQDPDYRIGWLTNFDPASAFLELRICDPAMGSGHFLVSLVDYLADQVMEATREASEAVDFGLYRSPLLDRLEAIRTRILSEAAEHRWTVEPAQLIDRQLVRRIILKRVIHGVDKNPMAVELAKLALWLHSFTVGAPLSFLDHHLRCGDSLFGEWVGPAIDRLERGGLFHDKTISDALREAENMARIEGLVDADVTEVHESQSIFAEVEAKTAHAVKLMSLLQGYRWIEGSAEDALKKAKALEKASNRVTGEESMRLAREAWELKRKGRALDVLLDGELGSPTNVLDQCYGRIGERAPRAGGEDPALEPLMRAAEIAGISNFLHWEIAFPNVWTDWRAANPRGGFDAIIGNPPWDRMKMQEVEWFAARRTEIAHAAKAADRKRMVAALQGAGDPLAADYGQASTMAALAARMATLAPDKGGQYPLLGRGDVNLYSLFVERAARLVKPDGLVGLLTPSGIAGDLNAAPFFRSVSTTGRLKSLLDYENRKIFFPDVHASFKFCAIVFGGTERRFQAAECGFFLRSTRDDDLIDTAFPLTPADFAAVNPNTGTAPVFRTVRDADLTTAIYTRLPVVVDRRYDPPRRPWPVRYLRMFDMTNDSHLFRTWAELEAEGWYRVAGGRIRRGLEDALPLYVGRMFRQFDHRAANVDVNEENLHNAAVSGHIDEASKADPNFLPEPQYWIEQKNIEKAMSWALAFRDIARPTDIRTVIASILPAAGYGNTAGLLLSEDAESAALLLANLNAFSLDFVARQKVQGTHVNWYILEQLPVIPPTGYDRMFGTMTARDIVRREVLHLTYTAHDMADFARDMGHVDADGAVLPPFPWDEADRRQRRARLDALYFHLYGLSREDADYILSTFPIVRDHDMRDHRRFLTRDLILGQMAALEAGDSDAVIIPV